MNLDSRISSNILLILICIGLFSCEKEQAGCFEGRGDQVTELREIRFFKHLHLKDRIEVELKYDSSNFAEVTFGENGVGGIELLQEGETLTISESNTCDWMRKVKPLPKVIVHYTGLNSIYSENSGKVAFSNSFKGDSLKIEIMDVAGEMNINVVCKSLAVMVHTGATDMSIQGLASYAYFYNSGYAPLRAKDLIARTVSVHNNSISDTYVNAWETVYYQIYHQGDIHITGPASIVKWHEEGGGQVFLE